MIACTYCGKKNDDAATHCRGCGTELHLAPVPGALPQPASEAPPELPKSKFINPAALEAGFHHADGFQRADWNFIGRWIDTNVQPLDVEDAWNEAALLWLTKLRDDLGGNFFVLQSGQTLLLCDQPLVTARWLLEYAGQAAATIKDQLGDTAWHGTFGKDVVVVFSDLDDYYQYLAFHSPDGEQAASGGGCIHSGYTHIAIPWQNEFDTGNAVVHELTHDCLAHLPLPLWLNEGVAVTLQKAIAPPPRALGQSEQDALFSASINWRAPIMWDELAERHFAFWNEDNIQSFWAGTSFYQPGDPNELSYSLAEVLVKLLSEQRDAAAFHAFLETANETDAGQTVAMDILGADLGEIAGTFLGKGNWRPQRKVMVACWNAAGWKKQGDGHNDHS